MLRSSAPTGDNGRAKGSGEAELEDGIAYRPVRPYKLPSHISKMVLSAVHFGPPPTISDLPSYVPAITRLIAGNRWFDTPDPLHSVKRITQCPQPTCLGIQVLQAPI